jgi:acetyltransferase
MVCELPALDTLEINPLVVDEDGCLAVDARLSIDPSRGAGQGRYAHMAIHPYPAHLRQEWPMRDGSVIRVRPVRPEDAPLEQAFVNAMSDESRYFRFMDSTRELPQPDRPPDPGGLRPRDGTHRGDRRRRHRAPDRQRPLRADAGRRSGGIRPGGRRRLAEMRPRPPPDGSHHRLRAREALRSMVGDVLADNHKMLSLMSRLGFAVMPHPDGNELKRVVKPLRE